jgi:hypothetical protein
VSYRVTFGSGAAIQYHDLPELAQDALVARAARLAEAPWDDAVVLPPGDHPAFRETLFGAGRGLLAFHVNDTEETVSIFNIVWVA